MPRESIPTKSPNKTLLVLGAKSDIAQATAHEFARHGYDIILAARNAEKLEAIRTDLEIRHSITAYKVEFDAERFDSHGLFYAALPAKPDAVLCAFGYLGEQQTAQVDLHETLRIANVNYVGAVSILNVVAQDFETRRAGTIIGISSVAGERGRQSNYLYGSAKAGFSVFLDGMRHRLARVGVHVVTVKPGFVRTAMTEEMDLPKALTAQPEQIGRAIFRAARRRQNTLYFFPVWRFVMFVIRNVPEFIFQKTKL